MGGQRVRPGANILRYDAEKYVDRPHGGVAKVRELCRVGPYQDGHKPYLDVRWVVAVLFGPLANASVLVQGFLRVHNVTVQFDRLGERAAVRVAGCVIKRAIPLELVRYPVVRGGILVGCCFFDDIQEAAMIDVVDEEMRGMLLRGVLHLGFRNGNRQRDPMPAIYRVEVVEAIGLARDVESAQVPRVELRGEEYVVDKALDLAV